MKNTASILYSFYALIIDVKLTFLINVTNTICFKDLWLHSCRIFVDDETVLLSGSLVLVGFTLLSVEAPVDNCVTCWDYLKFNSH